MYIKLLQQQTIEINKLKEDPYNSNLFGDDEILTSTIDTTQINSDEERIDMNEFEYEFMKIYKKRKSIYLRKLILSNKSVHCQYIKLFQQN